MTNRYQLVAIAEELKVTLEKIDESQLTALSAAIREARRVFVAGAGRSGLMMRSFAMRLIHLGVSTHVVGDVTTPAIGSGDLLLIGSGSGATASLVSHAAKAHTLGARVGLVTIRPDTPMAREASVIVTIPAPTPKLEQPTGYASIQPMGALFEQSLLLVLDGLILALMSETDQDAAALFARHANLE